MRQWQATMRRMFRRKDRPVVDLSDTSSALANPGMPVAGAAGFALLGTAMMRRRRQKAAR